MFLIVFCVCGSHENGGKMFVNFGRLWMTGFCLFSCCMQLLQVLTFCICMYMQRSSIRFLLIDSSFVWGFAITRHNMTDPPHTTHYTWHCLRFWVFPVLMDDVVRHYIVRRVNADWSRRLCVCFVFDKIPFHSCCVNSCVYIFVPPCCFCCYIIIHNIIIITRD